MPRRTLYEFKLLSDHLQYDVVFTEGKFIDGLIEENIHYVLYAVELFFVEIEYDVVKNKIVGKTSFVTGEKLDKYAF